MGKDKFVKEVLNVVNGGEKTRADEGVLDVEYQTGDEGRQYDQLFERIEELCVELQNIKDQIEHIRDKTTNWPENNDEEESIWIGSIEC